MVLKPKSEATLTLTPLFLVLATATMFVVAATATFAVATTIATAVATTTTAATAFARHHLDERCNFCICSFARGNYAALEV